MCVKNNVLVEEEKDPFSSAQAPVPHPIAFSADAPLSKKKATF